MRALRIFSSILCCALPVLAQNYDAFNKPFPAYKIIGNIYYVGTDDLGSYLIPTSAGNILINSDFDDTVPLIKASVEKLGFKFTDTKILLGSHAHGDHMDGDARVKELSGAQVMVMEQDIPAISRMTPGNKPHPIDRVLHDGDEVKLGGTTLVAHLTPGHTKGCTTWTMKTVEDGKSYNVVILGSIGVNPGYILVGNKDYPQIADDYVHGFQVLRSLPVMSSLVRTAAFSICRPSMRSCSPASSRIHSSIPPDTRHTSICRKKTSAPNWQSSRSPRSRYPAAPPTSYVGRDVILPRGCQPRSSFAKSRFGNTTSVRHGVNDVIDSDPDSQRRKLLVVSGIVRPLPRVPDIGLKRHRHHDAPAVVVNPAPARRTALAFLRDAGLYIARARNLVAIRQIINRMEDRITRPAGPPPPGPETRVACSP